MLVIEGHAATGIKPGAILTLPFELRQKSRLRANLDQGGEVSILLERGHVLRSGDLLQAKDGTVIEIRAAPEPRVEQFLEPIRVIRNQVSDDVGMSAPPREILPDDRLDSRPAPILVDPGTRPIAQRNDLDPQRPELTYPLHPRPDLAAPQHAAEEPLLRHDARSDFLEDRAPRVAFLANLSYFHQRFTDLKPRSDWKFKQNNPFRGNIFGKTPCF